MVHKALASLKLNLPSGMMAATAFCASENRRGTSDGSAEADGVRPTTAGPARILVVEDEPWIAMDMQRIVVDAGYDAVGLAQDASEAIHIAEETRPVLALMDIRLAGQRDGIDAAVELLRRFGIRSIFVSAHFDGATRRRAEEARPHAMVDKPIDPDALLAAIQRALGSH
jgi:two-component system, response regulator PdtaR